jgi:hypothetical protein
MGRKVLTRGWLRAVGAALTLAGAIVVFVVLFLPTSASARSTYCSSASFTGITWQWVSKGDHAGELQVFVPHSSRVRYVWFTANKDFGDHWVSDHISTSDRDPGSNSVFVQVPSEAADGPIRVNTSSDPNVCYTQSSKTFHPVG